MDDTAPAEASHTWPAENASGREGEDESEGGLEDDDEEEDGEEEDGEAMLWSLEEALERQTLQIGASACGATAVLDVLRVLGVTGAAVTPEDADRCVRTRLRRNESPLPDYLLSRSEAGATHAQLISGAAELSGGRVAGRFFHLHPRRRVRLGAWLARWVRAGAVPVATMNMQVVAPPRGEELPDAWHHQLVFGVLPGNAVFMANPLDVVSESELHQRLCSESVLLIRREDVMQRLGPPCPPLASLSEGRTLASLSEASAADPRWRTMDVEGQVRRMVLEEEEKEKEEEEEEKEKEEEEEEEEEEGGRGGGRAKLTLHLAIPAAYSAGVTVFALRDSDAGRRLLAVPDLPLLLSP